MALRYFTAAFLPLWRHNNKKSIREAPAVKKTLSFFICLLALAAPFRAQGTDEISSAALTPEKAVGAGNIVMISFFGSNSEKNHTDMEVYNTRRLEDFMQSLKAGSKDGIRIIKYGHTGTRVWVNKLYDLTCDDGRGTETGYDVYTDPKRFHSLPPETFVSMTRKDYPGAVWYGVGYSRTGGEFASLISFYKSSVVN